MEKSLIVAVADNYAIGRKNALLWNLPGDMKYFRQQTTGNAVIMGWMTFQSIGRPLPKRHNIVISLFPWPDAPAGVTVVDSLDAAFAAAEISPLAALGRDDRGTEAMPAQESARCVSIKQNSLDYWAKKKKTLFPVSLALPAMLALWGE
jgi:hypothetical protein